jgi:hypothetical protein
VTDSRFGFGDYPATVLAKFKRYHEKNPQVYEEFKRLAFQMKKTGRRKYSAEIIINVMRWHMDLKTSGDVFEINNDFKPIYARLLIYHYPEFQKFFEFRKVRSKGIGSQEQKEREGEQYGNMDNQQTRA